MKNANNNGGSPPSSFGPVRAWSARALDLWKARGRLLIRADSWTEFFEKQARNADASAKEFAGDYELEQYWQFQARDYRAIAQWFKENTSWLPSLPPRVSQ